MKVKLFSLLQGYLKEPPPPDEKEQSKGDKR